MVNPRLQKAILEAVENQLRADDPPETKQTFDRLLREGYSEDDAMKLIGRAVATDIYEVLSNKKPFDKERYVKALKELP